jgi:hypothetical protein
MDGGGETTRLQRVLARTTLGLTLSVVALAAARGAGDAGADEGRVDFGRDVRPLLSDNCFFCHGPDEATREADLRLDLEQEAFRDLGGYFGIVPGSSDESELYLRISDPDDPMPPKDAGRELSTAEIELIRTWIDQGAEWEAHWAYRTPVRPDPPQLAGDEWSANPIDRFLFARMRAEDLEPEPEASRETLVRRVTLDLTGLPPTPKEVDAFLKDMAPGAYGRLVERLLASPRYGEHMARAWLDAARYGDTHGLHLDNERSIWPYRDWVIEAFNRNLPFDRFTVEQLAGDLLPDATLEQRIATGFNRCNPTSAEGGMIEEEYLSIYAADRTETTAAVWLGTTMICARCHDHKFDPVSQREYYELSAFFSSMAGEASDGNALSPEPALRIPSPEQERELARLDALLAEKEAALDAPIPEVDERQPVWEEEWRSELAERWAPLEIVAFHSTGASSLRALEDGSIVAEGPLPDQDVYEVLARTSVAPTALRLEALPREDLEHGSIGRDTHGNIVLSGFEVALAPLGTAGELVDVPLELATATYSQQGFSVQRALDGDPQTGWAMDGRPGEHVAVFAAGAPMGDPDGSLLRIRLRFESGYARHELARFRLSVGTSPSLAAATLGPWHLVGPFHAADGDAAFDSDFGPEAGLDLNAPVGEAGLAWVERADLADGAIHELEGEACATYAFRTIVAASPRKLVLALGTDDAVKLWLNGEAVLDRRVVRGITPDEDTVELPLIAGENRLLLKVVNYTGGYAFTARRADEHVGGLSIPVAEALAHGADSDGVRAYYRREHSPTWRDLRQEANALGEERETLLASLPITLVAEELEEQRSTHVLIRGAYDRKGDEVRPDTPDCLPPLEHDAEAGRASRLDLARWLVQPDHPLTARVTVNRFWQELFGAGLVATTEDFGSQGAWPSHPELLDWLAVELVESGWDVKHLLRTILSTAAYRQASAASPAKRARDPNNRLLARGPRFRLDAERIRDSALAISGLLVERVGGPSVKPYQPGGLWQAVGYESSNTGRFERDDGDALYRRSLYTFWKRTSPPPSMQIFDAPTRESCVLGRARTNTPLQALALMNDVQFVEAARAFASRVLLAKLATERDRDRLVHAFRLATSRRPDAQELEVLEQLLVTERASYAVDPEAARALIDVGEAPVPEELDPVELAAWTHVTNLLLNLDEVVTRG